MSSPAKKRKLNNGSKTSAAPVKGLEYFFNKQKQNTPTESSALENGKVSETSELTDEELARKLQDEWNQEVTRGDQEEDRKIDENDVRQNETQNGASEEGPSDQHSHEAEGTNRDASSIPVSKPPEDKSKKTLTLQSAGTLEDSVTSSIPFDEPPLTFDPAKYVSQLQEHWASEGGDATYALLTRCFVLVSGTTSRIKIVDTLVNCLRVLIEGDPASLLPAVSPVRPDIEKHADFPQVWLATNSISPPYISLELGLGGSAISKALRQVCGLDNRSLKAIYDKYGDAGDVAFEAKKKQSFTLRKPKPLTIKGVYQSLVKIANSQGQGSAEAKQRLVDRLLQDARGGEESRFVVRTLCQHVRMPLFYH